MTVRLLRIVERAKCPGCGLPVFAETYCRNCAIEIAALNELSALQDPRSGGGLQAEREAHTSALALGAKARREQDRWAARGQSHVAKWLLAGAIFGGLGYFAVECWVALSDWFDFGGTH